MPHNNAPLSHVAQHLRSKGRGDDTMLIHMTPNEINSLQGLAMAHGGSLTINPDTGLPEAGWLSKLLPMVLGAIATPLTGGVINPFTASLLVGGGTAAITGDLKQGLMAGLSAYGAGALSGAAGLGANAFGLAPGVAGGASAAGAASTSAAGSLANMGASPALQAAATTPLTTGLSAAGTMAPIPVGAINAATGAVGAVPGAIGAGAANVGGLGSLGVSPALQTAATAPLNVATGAMAPIPLPTITPPSFLNSFADSARGGLDKIGISPTSAVSKYAPYAAGLGLVGGVSDVFQPKARKPGEIDYGNYYNESHLPPDRGLRTLAARTPYSGYDSSERQYYNTVNPAFQAPTVDPRIKVKMARGGSLPLEDGSFIVDARTVSELGNGSSGAGQDLLAKSGGQPIRGHGDGVSDSVRANIGGSQEARVARDEVKFGPDAVRRIGGGNHKTGTQKLYAMMGKAQAARKTAKRGEDTGLRHGLA